MRACAVTASCLRILAACGLLGLAACGSSDGRADAGGLDAGAVDAGGGEPDASPGDAGEGDAGDAGGSAIVVPGGTGVPLVDRLGATASTCGPQTPFTVPSSWSVLGVGEQGCSGWVPPGWLVSGSGTSLATALRDASGDEGFVGLAGVVDATVACTPPAVTEAVLAGFAENGYAPPVVLWQHEQLEEFGGSTWPTGMTVFSSAAGSTSIVGFLWLLPTQTVVACDVVGLGFWEPESAIETDTCMLTQILNSVRCGGGACADSSCNDTCQADGKPGGMCNTMGGCDCFE